MRSEQYIQGYRAAWKDAIEFLAARGASFRDPDPKAKQILDSAAFVMGSMKGNNRLEIDKPQES